MMVTMQVRPQRVTLLCLCCGQEVTARPEAATVWSRVHRQPMLVALDIVVDGKPERWEAMRPPMVAVQEVTA